MSTKKIPPPSIPDTGSPEPSKEQISPPALPTLDPDEKASDLPSTEAKLFELLKARQSGSVEAQEALHNLTQEIMDMKAIREYYHDQFRDAVETKDEDYADRSLGKHTKVCTELRQLIKQNAEIHAEDSKTILFMFSFPQGDSLNALITHMIKGDELATSHLEDFNRVVNDIGNFDGDGSPKPLYLDYEEDVSPDDLRKLGINVQSEDNSG